MEGGVRRHLDVIQRVTGTRPPMCPWRALYHPTVREVMSLSWSVEDGNLGAVLGRDPPGWLDEGVGVYQRALRRTRNEDEKLRIKAAEQKQKGGAR